MTSELDVYRSAHLLIKQHGENAALRAAQEADGCLDRGDHAGKVTWLRVIRAIEELQKQAPDDPSQVH